MTCIIGLIKNKKVYIGGDSAGVGGSELRISLTNCRTQQTGYL